MSIRRFACLLTFTALFIALVATPSLGTFSGDNGRITFAAFVEKTESVEIFSANADGSDVRKLTKSGRKHASFLSDWSPDGQTIAFDSDRVDVDRRKRAVQIYLMNADGSGVTQLTRGPGFHGAPGWAPDASNLAIDASWGGGHDQAGIWIIPATDPDGVTQDEARRLTTVPKGANFDSEPQYSPDGTSIVFSRFKSARESAIYKVNTDGTGLERLTPFGLNASDPDWSPDGQRIAFDSGDAGRPGSRGNIYVMDADGGNRKRLTDNPRITRNSPFRLANNPVFSPDGTEIGFTQFFDRRTQLMVMSTNGSNKRVLLRKGGGPNKIDWGTNP
jgi:Tol biopolymer transport system component